MVPTYSERWIGVLTRKFLDDSEFLFEKNDFELNSAVAEGETTLHFSVHHHFNFNLYFIVIHPISCHVILLCHVYFILFHV